VTKRRDRRARAVAPLECDLDCGISLHSFQGFADGTRVKD